jgi:putative spermidine/putrescine transport system permease protein
MAFYMSVVAGPRLRRVLVVAVLTPLWASYLVKAYAWRTLFAPDGPMSWATNGHTPGYGEAATVVTLAYLWLPYMVIPVFAGFERLPRSLFEASADLGAATWRTVRSVVLPLVFPAIAAGSIFTFSLTLGDYIAVSIVGGKTQLIANVIRDQVTLNQPLAAAVSFIPSLGIVLYLAAMRRTGALENV